MAQSKYKFKNENGELCADLLNSENLLNDFYTFMVKSNHSVYALTGSWGTGKTSLIQMFMDKLDSEPKEENNKEKMSIYIDAFRMDYELDPLMMMIKAFKDYLSTLETDTNISKFIDKSKDIFVINNILKFGFNILLDKTAGKENFMEFINSAKNELFDKLSEKDILYNELRKTLNEIMSKRKQPLYIIIDELDRCRPDFALETLERIKHIFQVQNVKFILVYNDKIMNSIICKNYGDDIDANKYMSKFVQKKYPLGVRINLKEFVNNELEKKRNNFSYDTPSYIYSSMFAIRKIIGKYNFSLRDMQQFMTILENLNISNDLYYLTFASMELLKIINNDEFNNIAKHCKEKGKFSNETPTRETLKEIYKCFERSENEKLELSDDIVCKYFETDYNVINF